LRWRALFFGEVPQDLDPFVPPSVNDMSRTPDMVCFREELLDGIIELGDSLRITICYNDPNFFHYFFSKKSRASSLE
jgi:hypothetical protein